MIYSAFLPRIENVSQKTQLNLQNLTVKKDHVIIKDFMVITW